MTAKIYHTHLWGTREKKYAYLAENDIATTEWTELAPQSPFYLFVPQDTELLNEYEQGWKIPDIFPVNSVGVCHGPRWADDPLVSRGSLAGCPRFCPAPGRRGPGKIQPGTRCARLDRQ